MDNFKGVHHGYLGLLMMALSFFLIWSHVSTLVVSLVFVLGLIIFTDDFYQHLRQRKKPEYHSPLHRLFRFAYGWPILKWLDKLFGKGK